MLHNKSQQTLGLGAIIRLVLIAMLVTSSIAIPGDFGRMPPRSAAAAAAVIPTASLAVDKSLARPGETLAYTLTVSGQPGQSDAAVSVVASLPANTTYVSGSVTGGGTYTSSSKQIEWSGTITAPSGSVPSKVITFQTTVNSAATAGDVIVAATLASGSDRNTATASTAIDASFPTITKAVDRSSASAGDTLEYTVTISGASGQRDASIALTDPLPTNVTYVASSATGGATYNSSARQIEWSGTVTAPGGSLPSKVITFRVTVNAGVTKGDATNVATISDGTNLSSAAATTSVGTSPPSSLGDSAPTISKSVNRSAASAGGELEYTISISGQPSMADTAIVMTDTIPSNTTYVAASVTGGATYDSGSRQIRWSGTVTAPGGSLPSKVITFKVAINSGVVAGNVSNPVTMSSGANLANARATTSVVVGLPTVSKTVDLANFRPGGTVIYTITLSGQANQSDTPVSLEDPIPANADYVSGSVTGGATYNGTQNRIEWSGTITASGGSLPSKVITFQVTLKSGVTAGNLVNLSQVSDGTNLRRAKAAGALQTTLPTIMKTADRSIASPGQAVEYTLTISGYSGMADTQVTVTDPIPTNTTYVSGSVTGGATYNSSSNRIEWSGVATAPSGSLPSKVITFRVTVGSGLLCGNITNTATLSDGTSSTTASAVVAVDTAFPSLSKSVDKSSAAPGDTLEYTLSLAGRTGACDLSVSLTDAIPSNTTHVSGSVTGGATYNSGSNRIEWSGYVTQPSGSLPLKITTFRVTVDSGYTAGQIVNTASLSDGSATIAQTATTNVAVPPTPTPTASPTPSPTVTPPSDTTPPVLTGAPTVAGFTQNTAIIEWTTNEASTSIVQYGTSPGSLGQSTTDSTPVSTHRVTLTSLAASTTYYYRVGSTDASGNGPTYSGTHSFTTAAAPDSKPPVITMVPTALSISRNTATIQWGTDEVSTSIVQYGTSPSLGLSSTDSTYVLAHGMTLSGLSPSTIYYFRVGSTDSSGNGPTYHNIQIFTTTGAADTKAPEATSPPTALGITQSSTTIEWTTDEVGTSLVQYGTSPGSLGLIASDSSMAVVHKVTLTGLSTSTTYYFRVGSVDGSGNGPSYSAVLSFTTAPAADTAAPEITGAPTVVRNTDTTAVIVWTTNEPSNSIVQYGTTTAYGMTQSVAGIMTFHMATLTGLSASTTYNFRVGSVDASGNGPIYSGNYTLKTHATPDTAAPQITSAPTVSRKTDTTAVIVWTTNEPSNSMVQYGTTTAYGQSQTIGENVAIHSVTLTGLIGSTTYNFRVGSMDAVGNGPAYSGNFSFSTYATPDTAPPQITSAPTVARRTDTAAVIVWTTNEPANSIVQYGTTTAYGRSQTIAENVTIHTVTLTGLSSSTSYNFKVGSVDASGNGPVYSSNFSFTTYGTPDTASPQITSAPTVARRTDTSAVIIWNTNEPSNSIVQYGATTEYDQTQTLAENTTVHIVALTGLTGSTTYNLRVGSVDASGNGPTYSSNFSFTTYAAADTTPPQITFAPTVARKTDTTAAIIWATNEPSNSMVEYGTTTAYGLTQTVAENTTFHVVMLTGLTGSTTYSFRAGAVDAAGNGPAYSSNFSFTTYATPDTASPKITSAPTVARRTDTTAVIVWRTNEPSNSIVEYGTTSAYGLTESLAENTGVHVATLTGLSGSTTYNFRVGSVDASGNGPTFSGNFSFTTYATPDTTAPQITSAPTVARKTDTSAVIVWNTNEHSNSIVEFGTTAGYGQVETVAENTTSHEVTLAGLSGSTTFNFRVGSVDAAGNGPTFSGNFSFTTYATPDTVAPRITSAPTVARQTDASAVIIWNTDEPSTSIVQYGTTTAYGLEQAAAENTTLHVVTLTGLSSSTTYDLRVGSVDANGNGPTFSGNVSFTTYASPDTAAPRITSPPTVARRTNSTADILWGTDEPSNSIVEYGTTTGYGLVQSVAENAGFHIVTLTGLSASTAYDFRVGAVDPSGNGPTFSENFGFSTDPAPDTSAPKITNLPGVSAKSDTTALIVWKTDEPSNSLVEFGTASVYNSTQAIADSVSNHAVALTGLSPAILYHYRVGSVDATGNGPTFSADFTFITDPTPDTTAPQITGGPIVDSKSSTSAVIVWTTDEPSNSLVDFGTTTAYTMTQSMPDNVTRHSVTMTDLAASTTYSFRVGSKDAANNGPTLSGNFSFTTDPLPDTTPPNILGVPRVTSASSDRAEVVWDTDEPGNTTVEYAEVATAVVTRTLSLAENVTSHRIALTNLSPGTSYSFRAGTIDAAGNGPTWGSGTFRTDPQADATAPIILRGPDILYSSNNRASIVWTTDEPSDSTFIFMTPGYQSPRSVFDGAFVTVHRINVMSLNANTRYVIMVQSRDPSGNLAQAGIINLPGSQSIQSMDQTSTGRGASAQELSFSTSEIADSTAPTITRGPKLAYKTDRSAIIEWTTDEAADSHVEYTLAQSGSEVGPAAVFAGILALKSNLTFSKDHLVSVTNLSPDTTYTFRVSSRDPSGNGPTVSVQGSFKTNPAADVKAPEILTGPVVIPTDTTIRIEWSTNEPSDGVVEFKREGSGMGSISRVGPASVYAGEYQVISDVEQATNHSVTLTNLTPNTTYTYRVSSTDPSGNGPTKTADLSITTKAANSAPVRILFPLFFQGYKVSPVDGGWGR